MIETTSVPVVDPVRFMRSKPVPLKLNVAGKVSKVWVATPDAHAGASQELAFEQKDGAITFTLPSLKYWSMIVME